MYTGCSGLIGTEIHVITGRVLAHTDAAFILLPVSPVEQWATSAGIGKLVVRQLDLRAGLPGRLRVRPSCSGSE
jgi:hypothetical protein